MSPEIREAFEAAVISERAEFNGKFRKSDAVIRREATLLIKRIETVIENLPDQSMTILEFYEEIAGTAWRG